MLKEEGKNPSLKRADNHRSSEREASRRITPQKPTLSRWPPCLIQRYDGEEWSGRLDIVCRVGGTYLDRDKLTAKDTTLTRGWKKRGERLLNTQRVEISDHRLNSWRLEKGGEERIAVSHRERHRQHPLRLDRGRKRGFWVWGKNMGGRRGKGPRWRLCLRNLPITGEAGKVATQTPIQKRI